ncbi:MAG: T9SS type A sorting domain-containing protein [Bacteroidota bacterium]
MALALCGFHSVKAQTEFCGFFSIEQAVEVSPGNYSADIVLELSPFNTFLDLSFRFVFQGLDTVTNVSATLAPGTSGLDIDTTNGIGFIQFDTENFGTQDVIISPSGVVATVFFSLATGDCQIYQIVNAGAFIGPFTPCEGFPVAPESGICNGDPEISGEVNPVRFIDTVNTFDNALVRDTSLIDYSTLTDSLNEYTLEVGSNTVNQTHTVFVDEPDYTEYDCGVTTLDRFIVRRHILGIESFEFGWQKVAADLNNDAEINVIDIVQMRRTVLGIGFPDASGRPWDYPTLQDVFDIEMAGLDTDSVLFDGFYRIDPLGMTQISKDFTAVKIGDINADCDYIAGFGLITDMDSLLSSSGYTLQSVDLEIDNTTASQDEIINIPIKASQLNKDIVLSLGLEFDPLYLDFLSIDSDSLILTSDMYAYDAATGQLIIHYDAPLSANNSPASLSNVEVFNIELKAKQNIEDLSAHISLHENKVDNLFFISNVRNKYFAINLKWNTGSGKRAITSNSYEVFSDARIFPNPFTNQIFVDYQSENHSQLVINLIDISGRSVTEESFIVYKGSNRLTFDVDAALSMGTYLLKLTDGQKSIVRKLIKTN